MNLYLFIGAIIGLIWMAGVFLGVVKGVTKGFESTPTVDVSESRKLRDKASEDAAAAQEKNQKLMDDVKSKMDRNRF